MEARTFKEAYEVLQRHAESLRNQAEPNIDDLLEIVNESVAAYKVCKQRIDAVETALEEALMGAGLEGSRKVVPAAATLDVTTQHRQAPPQALHNGFEERDDDIPF